MTEQDLALLYEQTPERNRGTSFHDDDRVDLQKASEGLKPYADIHPNDGAPSNMPQIGGLAVDGYKMNALPRTEAKPKSPDVATALNGGVGVMWLREQYDLGA